MGVLSDIRRQAELALGSRSATSVASEAGLPRNAVWQFLRGNHEPKAGRLIEICTALGMEFYVGSPRLAPARPRTPATLAYPMGPETADSAGPPLIPLSDLERSTQGLVRLTTGAGGDPIPEDLWPVLLERRRLIAPAPDDGDAVASAEIATQVSDASAPSTEAANEDELILPFAGDVRAAAGSGETVFEEAADLRVAIPRSILPQWAQPADLICIRTAGDSMEPTLSDGDFLLLDRSQIDPQGGQVFVIYTDDGLLVKRLREDGDGWELTSDNPAYPPRRSGESDRIVGQVAWSGALRMTEAHGG